MVKTLISALVLWSGLAAAESPAGGDSTTTPARVYVFWESSLFKRVHHWTLRVDREAAKTRIDKDRYHVAQLEPGRHMLYAEGDFKHGLSHDFQPGQEYYVACGVAFTGKSMFWKSDVPCSLAHPELGAARIAQLKPQTEVRK